MKRIIRWVGKALEIILAIILAILLIFLSIAVLPIIGTIYLTGKFRGDQGPV